MVETKHQMGATHQKRTMDHSTPCLDRLTTPILHNTNNSLGQSMSWEVKQVSGEEVTLRVTTNPLREQG